MAKQQEIKINRDGFEFVWKRGVEPNTVEVNAYFGTSHRLVMEWIYPKMRGCGGLMGQVAFWGDQAVLQANNELWSCMDCHQNTQEMGEYYMVHNEVWEAACPKEDDRKGILCLGCLEKRLGRPLLARDFTACQANVDSVPVQCIIERTTPTTAITHQPTA